MKKTALSIKNLKDLEDHFDEVLEDLENYEEDYEQINYFSYILYFNKNGVERITINQLENKIKKLNKGMNLKIMFDTELESPEFFLHSIYKKNGKIYIEKQKIIYEIFRGDSKKYEGTKSHEFKFNKINKCEDYYVCPNSRFNEYYRTGE